MATKEFYCMHCEDKVISTGEYDEDDKLIFPCPLCGRDLSKYYDIDKVYEDMRDDEMFVRENKA